MESGLDLRAGWDTLPHQTTEWKVACSEMRDTDLVPFLNPLLKGMTSGCLELSLSCFSAEGHLCVFPIGNSNGQKKDWINLNFTAARLQWALCVCLH